MVLQLVLGGVGGQPRDAEGEVGVALEVEGAGGGAGSWGVELHKVECECDHPRAIIKVDLQAERGAEVLKVVLVLRVIVSFATSLDLFSFVLEVWSTSFVAFCFVFLSFVFSFFVSSFAFSVFSFAFFVC